LKALRIDITPKEVGELFDRFDNGTGKLGYKEYLDLLGFKNAATTSQRER